MQLASGTYYFRAFFTGTGLNNNSSSDWLGRRSPSRQPTSLATTLHETNRAGVDVSPATDDTITINAGGYVVDYAT